MRKPYFNALFYGIISAPKRRRGKTEMTHFLQRQGGSGKFIKPAPIFSYN